MNVATFLENAVRERPDHLAILCGDTRLTYDELDRGGYKVYAVQVEAVLLTHPAVANAAVVGIPDERFGEELRAFVTLKDGAQCSEDELIAWTRERLAAYAYPRHVEFVPSLPLGPTGKVIKRLLV